MRLRVLIVAVLLVAPLAAWMTWRSSHRETPRGAVTRWEIHDAKSGIGIVSSAVRCGDALFLAEIDNQKIRRFDLESATSTSMLPVARGLPFALAADCHTDTLYVFGLFQALQADRPGSAVRAFNVSSGETQRDYAIPGLYATESTRMYRSGRHSLSIGPVFRKDMDAFFKSASADTYYRDARLGQELSLNTGEVRPLLEPYEPDCVAGADCSLVSVAPSPDGGWVAAQPGSSHIGIYASSGNLVRRIDIRTPGFQRRGPPLPFGTHAEETIRWGVANSTIWAVFPFEKYVATVHRRSKLGPDWTFGRYVNWTVLMNIHTYDGALVRADMELADIPVGQDAGGLFVVDYGADGRQSGLPKVTLLRYAVP